MTLEDAQTAVDLFNANPITGTTAVVGQLISQQTFDLDYAPIYITNTAVAGYNAADIITKSKYGQAFYYALAQVQQGGDFVTNFDSKLTELLG
jgi:hypothetical protein